MTVAFYDNDRVLITGGRFRGYLGIVNNWLHDDWYIVRVTTLRVRVVLSGSEMIKTNTDGGDNNG
jgi:hypothetical protein